MRVYHGSYVEVAEPDIGTKKPDIENLFTKFLHFSAFTCFFLLFMLL